MRISTTARIIAPLAVLAATIVPITAATAAQPSTHTAYSCPPSAIPLGFSDALDKIAPGGVTVGGLSSIAYDRRRGAYVSSVDNHGTDPARLWFYRDIAHPHIVGEPLVLRRPDGTPYTGQDSDNEGLAILPDGDYLVSSETEPSIRIYGRDGVQRDELPVPARFAVAPGGEASVNATLEGLTISPSGRYIYASMEGTLSGDAPASGEARWRRIAVYTRHGHGYELTKQIGYEVDSGMRIPEVAAYGDGKLLVLEAAFAADIGNTIRIYAVSGANRSPDVSDVGNLSNAPAGDIVRKTLVSDVTMCPSLGAKAREPQTNPLMDNFEGMYVKPVGPAALVTLISDDNFNATQTTRVLNLLARLP